MYGRHTHSLPIILAHSSDHRQDSVLSTVIVERAKQVQAVELGTATVHHRRVVIGPTTPQWYRECRGSHSKIVSMFEAVFTCSVVSGNVTSGRCIAPEGPVNIVSETTIC